MISYEIASAMAPMFDKIGPSHDEITALFRKAGLQAADPIPGPTEKIGKMRRVRAVLSHAAVHARDAGAVLVQDLLAALRACGSFRAGSPNDPGPQIVASLRSAFDHDGYILDDDGSVRRKNLENLEGVELTEALHVYVRRAAAGHDDAPLLVGTSKDLTEATARHVLVETTGSYPPNFNFEATLFNAADRLGLATLPNGLKEMLDSDPVRAMDQGLQLAALAANRYRNQQGSGHGRPHPSQGGDAEARLASQVAGIVSERLLRALEESRHPVVVA